MFLYGKKMRELYELYLELGHEVFEEKIKKPMELYYLHNTPDSSNVISMSSLNNFDANNMQSYKLGDATFDEDDLFSPLSFDEEIYFDDTLPPIYDDYCDDTYTIKNTFLQVDHDKNVGIPRQKTIIFLTSVTHNPRSICLY